MFFWYRLTRVFPDKFHRAVKRLCVCVCVVVVVVDFVVLNPPVSLIVRFSTNSDYASSVSTIHVCNNYLQEVTSVSSLLIFRTHEKCTYSDCFHFRHQLQLHRYLEKVNFSLVELRLQRVDDVSNIIDENCRHLLPNLNVLVAVCNCMQAVKRYCNEVLKWGCWIIGQLHNIFASVSVLRQFYLFQLLAALQLL